jgi:hypothetical protein
MRLGNLALQATRYEQLLTRAAMKNYEMSILRQ